METAVADVLLALASRWVVAMRRAYVSARGHPLRHVYSLRNDARAKESIALLDIRT